MASGERAAVLTGAVGSVKRGEKGQVFATKG